MLWNVGLAMYNGDGEDGRRGCRRAWKSTHAIEMGPFKVPRTYQAGLGIGKARQCFRLKKVILRPGKTLSRLGKRLSSPVTSISIKNGRLTES
jgi:hypothetical protein